MSALAWLIHRVTHPGSASSRRVLAVLLGLSTSVVAAILRLALTPVLGGDLRYLTFFPAVAIASWAAGLWGGLSALLASTLFAGGLFLIPGRELDASGWAGLVIFDLSGVLIAALGGQLNQSRAVAERARERASFLADVSALLYERIDRIAAIEALTRAAVPRFCDRCAIDLFDDEGQFVDARLYATDPAIVAMAAELRRRYPYDPGAPRGVPAVLRTGRPEYELDVPRQRAAEVADPERRRLLEALWYRSSISVPLAVPDGRRIGVLTVRMSDSGRRFTEDDVAVMVELGRRAGVALDHAALFDEVTARRDELDAVIRAMDDPVLVAAPDGRIRSCNAAAARVLGSVAGRRLGDVVDELIPMENRPAVRRVPATGRYVVPLIFDTRAGRSTVRIAVLRDTTELLENEAARDAFIGMLSHELRTPITTIFGTAQMLRRPLRQDQRDDLLDDVAAEADRLYRLVEDLLVLSRFERGRLDIVAEPVLVQRVVNTALARATAMHPGLRVSVEAVEPIAPALADTTYVEQIVRNLISNTVKYAGEAARIDVRMRADDDVVHLEFEDDGPGIPEHAAERVFGLYERLGESAFKPGAGIGLFVCRRLVEAMGGTMGVRRGAGGGACFSVTLPVLHDEAIPPRQRTSLYDLQEGDARPRTPSQPQPAG